MRTRWLHSPLRTAGITTALFAAGHAIASTTCVTEIGEQVLPCNSRCCRGIKWRNKSRALTEGPNACGVQELPVSVLVLGSSPHALSRRPWSTPHPPPLSPRCRRLRFSRTFRQRCSRQSSPTSICRACARCVASRKPCARSSVAATFRRHGTLSEKRAGSPVSSLLPGGVHTSSEQHASGCPNFRPTSAHQPFRRGHGRDGLLFDTGVAGAQPGGAPVAGGEEEAGLRDRLCRGRRARDRAGGTQPPASAAAAAAATASALRRHSCTRARLRARFRERLRERVDERLDERLCVRARSRPLEQRVQCRRLQPELELEPR